MEVVFSILTNNSVRSGEILQLIVDMFINVIQPDLGNILKGTDECSNKSFKIKNKLVVNWTFYKLARLLMEIIC